MNIKNIILKDDIAKCYSTYLVLRPLLKSVDEFVNRILEQFSEQFKLVAVETTDGEIVACCGFREMNTLAWGKIVYIDDLVTHELHGGNGYASRLLNYVIEYAQTN